MVERQHIRVLLVDPHALFRKGLARLLAGEPDFEVVGEGASGREAVALVTQQRPNIVLMDLALPGLSGLEAMRRMQEAAPETRIVILTSSDADADLGAAITGGAQGYLLKTLEPSALFRTLRGVWRGEVTLPRSRAARGVAELARHPRPSPAAALTPREREVLGCVAQGWRNKEIAAALAITENTVKNHLKSLLAKLHLENRIQAAAVALREGLLAGAHGPSPERPPPPPDRSRP